MKRTAEYARTAVRAIGAVEMAAAAFFLLAIFVLVLLQVFLRYFPIWGQSAWTGEFARYSMVWMTFAVIGVLITRNEHPLIESIDLLVKGRGRQIVIVAANVIVAAVAIAFAWDSAALVFTDVPIKTPVMHIPMQLAMAVPFAGFVLAALHALVRAFAVAVGVEKGDDETVVMA